MFAWAFEVGVVAFAAWALVTQVVLPVWRQTPLWPAFSSKARRERRIAEEIEQAAQRVRESLMRAEADGLRRAGVGGVSAERRSASKLRRIDREDAE